MDRYSTEGHAKIISYFTEDDSSIDQRRSEAEPAGMFEEGIPTYNEHSPICSYWRCL
jgi:hypothetical protein